MKSDVFAKIDRDDISFLMDDVLKVLTDVNIVFLEYKIGKSKLKLANSSNRSWSARII